MGGNINLTKLWMASIIAIFVVVIIFGNYMSFCSLHLPGQPAQCNIDPKYQNVFNNISSQYNALEGIGNEAKDQNLVTQILNFGSNLVTGTVNVFVLGLGALGKFFGMIPLIGNVITAIGSVIPGASNLISLLILIVGLYVAMRYIQSASNIFELP